MRRRGSYCTIRGFTLGEGWVDVTVWGDRSVGSRLNTLMLRLLQNVVQSYANSIRFSHMDWVNMNLVF